MRETLDKNPGHVNYQKLCSLRDSTVGKRDPSVPSDLYDVYSTIPNGYARSNGDLSEERQESRGVSNGTLLRPPRFSPLS